MRKFALSIAASLMLAAPAAAHAGNHPLLTSGEAQSAARAYVRTQVQALEQFDGLTVAATRVAGQVERAGRARITVRAAFALRWDAGPSFVCMTRVLVAKHGRSVRANPGNLDCGAS